MSCGSDVARVETSTWEARERTSIVEVLEKIIAGRGNAARVEASTRKAR